MIRLRKFIYAENGAELAEYAVTVALLVAIGLVVYTVIGQSLADQNSGTGAQVENVPRTFPFN
jgi:Flp pilus assembly pilin Flp